MRTRLIKSLIGKGAILACAFLVATAAFSQNKKDRKKLKIKSSTEYETVVIDGKSVTYKESFEEYDKEGRLITKIEYQPDGTILTRITAEYDGYGLKIAETELDVNKKKNLTRTFRYNALKDKTEESEFSADGLLLKKTIFKYDANGNPLTETEYDAAGNLLKTVTNAFNKKELKVSRQTVNVNGVMENSKSWEYEYY